MDLGERWVSAASLTNWGVIPLRSRLHLVGVLLGGHPRIDDGVWLISSPVLLLNDTHTLAITASSGRFYSLGRKFEGDAWPDEALELIARAILKWRVKERPPTGPIPWDRLPDELAQRGLDGTIDPWMELDKLAKARAALVAGSQMNGSWPGASLSDWAAIELGGGLRLVGKHQGGYEGIPKGDWLVTSLLWFLDPDAGTAVTTSCGRHYRLTEPLRGSLPEGAKATIAEAMARWGMAGSPPSEPLIGPALRVKIIQYSLDGTSEFLGGSLRERYS
jgi:hypothetical protein